MNSVPSTAMMGHGEIMKAAVNTRYGSPDVVEIRQAPRPVANAGEALIKVRTTTISRTDCGMLRPRHFLIWNQHETL